MPQDKIFNLISLPEGASQILAYLCVAMPTAYIFMDLKFNKIIPVIFGIVGILLMYDQFVHKSKLIPAKDLNLGPEPLIQPGSESYDWETDAFGNRIPRRTIRPPMR